MKKAVWIFIFFAGLSYLFFNRYFKLNHYSEHVQMSSSVGSQKRLVRSNISTPNVSLKKSEKTETVSLKETPRNETPKNETLKNETVEIEMVDGIAVAFGDTLLGAPLEGQVIPAKGARAEMPSVEYWKGGVVPYFIQQDVPNPGRIEKAIEFFNQHTAVRFVPLNGQLDGLIFQKGTEHCYSYLGKKGGLQPIMLADHCETREILHELMHALGFVHEQSRTDRDRFVEIVWNNIEDKYRSQYAMVSDALMESYRGSPFDLHSIMLYDPTAFALKKGTLTMRSLTSEALQAPPAQLSEQDIHRVNQLYGFE